MTSLHETNVSHAKVSGDDPVSAGNYLAEIVSAEFVPMGHDERPYLELTFRIIEGPHAGRCLSRLLDPNSPNRVAKAVYRMEVTKICKAVNIPSPQNWDNPDSYTALCGRSLVISVHCITYTAPTGENVTINQVVGYAKK